MDGWTDTCLQVMEFFQCSYGTFRFLPDCFSHPWIQAGWGKRDRCVCVCVCGGEGAGEEREEETAEFTKAEGKEQICSKVPATDARCGHSDLLWLELRTASSSAPRGPLVPLATELWLSLNGDGLFVTLYRRQGSRPSPRKRNVKRQNGCLRRPYK